MKTHVKIYSQCKMLSLKTKQSGGFFGGDPHETGMANKNVSD
jgi:hypothetical protein